MFFIFLKAEIEKLVPKKQDYLNNKILRDRAGVARWAHNPKVVSSSLAPATEQKGLQSKTFLHFTLTTFIIMYVSYALYSEKFDILYIGYTQDLISRFHSHYSLAKSGFTVKYRPWKVIYVDF